MPSTLASIGLSAFLVFSPAPKQPVAVTAQSWQPVPGDFLVVDTQENMGYLIRADRSAYLPFPVVTGQRRVVHYIGRTYDATTPTWDWVAKELDIKGDRITFGPSGRFLRLFRHGTDRTAYGIHEHRSEARMFEQEPTRYQSMGCIIVQRSIMDILESTFFLNGGALQVRTRYGLDLPQELAARPL